MKVLCIDDSIRPCDFPGYPHVVEGCIYDTIGMQTGHGADGTKANCYRLQEFASYLLWDIDRFIPLSDIDETEMERNYKREPQPNRIPEIKIATSS